MSDGQLKSFYDRINRLMDERDGISADISDLFQEVKSAGYVPKVLRKIIARRRADPSKIAEEDALQDLYEAALDSKTREAVRLAREGRSAREIEEATGIDQATVARDVPVKGKAGRKPKLSQGETNKGRPHDPETGEIVEAVEEPAGREEEASTSAQRFMDQTGGSVTVEINASPGSLLDRVGAALEEVAPGRVHRNVQIGGADDDLEPPPFLDRRAKATA